MTAPDSARNFLVSVLGFIRERKLLVAAIAVVLGIGLSWLIHLPTGYSGHAHPSQAISTDFSSGFSVAWEMTSKDLGVDGPVVATTRVDGVLVAVTGKKDGSSKGATTFSGTLIGIDPSGSTPTVLWRHEFNSESGTLFTWDDSIIAGGETIRASDGTVTATWDTPLPTTVGYDHDRGSPRVLFPRPSWGDGGSFVPITSSVVVTCTPINDSRSGDRNEGPSCTGWHKDGTQAWNYAVTRNADGQTVQPTGVATVDDHLIVGHSENDYDLYVDSFLSLVDGSVTDLDVPFSGRISIDNVYATSDGWIINGMGYSQLEDGDIAVLNPDGSLREMVTLTTNSLGWRTLITTTCTDTDGLAVLPTAEQALTALRTGHGWTPMCSGIVTPRSGSDLTTLNGRSFLAADKDGTPTYTDYEQGAFLSADGSLILGIQSIESDKKNSTKEEAPALYYSRSGVKIASLSQVGARTAQPFYDDLLIATPVPQRNFFLRYLGGYPHPDTVLMGITPRRAS
ncbi:hypothetical protein O3669_07940 [Pauljensenia sp. 20925_1_34]|uniref:hypothetical protein n=1 Tax=Pauljensenia sp. 20925_1_34 TaxID=3003674 RepID=UPI00352F3467